jgi:hypothetical protein
MQIHRGIERLASGPQYAYTLKDLKAAKGTAGLGDPLPYDPIDPVQYQTMRLRAHETARSTAIELRDATIALLCLTAKSHNISEELPVRQLASQLQLEITTLAVVDPPPSYPHEDTVRVVREVALIVDALESRLSVDAHLLPDVDPANLAGHWIPSSKLIDKADPRISTAAKVKAFCKKHEVPHRRGTTSTGKPSTQRCDVHLESWTENLASLKEKDAELRDAADALTANKALFNQMRDADNRQK